MDNDLKNIDKQSDRIQIRAFWLSKKQTPYVYKYFKNKRFTNKGDMVFEIRDSITTGIVLNNFVPGLANFIGSLGDRLTLEKVISFINLMTDQKSLDKSMSDDEIEKIASKINLNLLDSARQSSSEQLGSQYVANETGITSLTKTTDLKQRMPILSNESSPEVAQPVTNSVKAESSQRLGENNTNPEHLTKETTPEVLNFLDATQETKVDSPNRLDSTEINRRVKRNRKPLNQLGNLSK
ncbi:hypothetical protein I7V28_19420 [Lelliottia amnigena]|uniref:hypothetical protein n=1 Tax=Lelliottia TaxID=1330545 RepID=UPI00192ACAFF|nr:MULTISPECIES: hypothetical protein [Lelliottia]MBL5885675.1 hypothetical protein [Lelliottia aquatilis]MBL5923253.1 hypothetical protein [Lelliottia amnigena]MBL5932163.1 hypothetical protein [Lelliottia amnigena]